MKIRVEVNGQALEPDVHPGETVMELLRRLGFVSVKDGCNHGDCGTCAVLLDGRAVTTCLLFAGQVDGGAITTTEGLSGREGLDPLQQAMLDTGGVQCGYCIPGMLMSAVDLLSHNPDPSDRDIRVGLAGNLCRCTGYVKQIEAVRAAADLLQGGDLDG